MDVREILFTLSALIVGAWVADAYRVWRKQMVAETRWLDTYHDECGET